MQVTSDSVSLASFLIIMIKINGTLNLNSFPGISPKPLSSVVGHELLDELQVLTKRSGLRPSVIRNVALSNLLFSNNEVFSDKVPTPSFYISFITFDFSLLNKSCI